MTVGDWLIEVNDALRGVDEDAPTFGDGEASYWVRLLNRKKNWLFKKRKVLFDETWEARSLGTVTVDATPSFDCDDELIAPSDQVLIVDTDGNNHYFDIIRPKERPKTGKAFYLAGMNPRKLYCTSAITTGEAIVGGTVHLPGHYMPADVTAVDDEVPLPDPYWGALSVAAEVAGNDITYEDKEENLTNKANDQYKDMVRNARAGTYGNPRKGVNAGYRIRNTETR